MPQLPHGHRIISRTLIDIWIPRQHGLRDGRIDRLGRCETVKTAAAHERNLIDQDVALCAQLASVTSFTEDTRGRVAAAVAKAGESDFDQSDAFEMRDQFARVVACLDADCICVRLIGNKGVERHSRLVMRLVVSEARPLVRHLT